MKSESAKDKSGDNIVNINERIRSLSKRAILGMMSGAPPEKIDIKGKRLTIKELESLLFSPEGTKARRIIGPEIAVYILEHYNEKNSKVRQSAINTYAKHMADKYWPYTGDAIVFTNEPMMASGQHRLLACIQANCEFETDLSFGHDPVIRKVRNSGKRDKPEDYLALDGWKNPKVVAGAIRWVLLYERHKGGSQGRTTEPPTFYPSLAKGFDRPALERCVKVAVSIHKKVTQVPEQYLAAVYYIARQKDKRYADEFFEKWAEGSPPSAAIKVQQYLLKLSQRVGNKSGYDWPKFVAVIAGWNKYYSGNSRKHLPVGEWDVTMDVPVIIGPSDVGEDE